MRSPIMAVIASALALAVAAPAGAEDTQAEFTITGGTLSISVPVSTVDLGDVAAGSLTHVAQLGPVTVSDSRGALVAEWEATVSSTDFDLVGGTATAAETVAAGSVAYASGEATASTGTGTFLPGAATSLDPAVDPLLRLGGSWAGVGSNSVTWNPTLTFTFLASQVAGTYRGTITHSVA